MDKRFFWIVTGILVVVIFAAAIASLIINRPPTYNGSVINPPAPAPGFSLLDQNNQTIRLADFKGKYVLLFFGYTNCTNECPATMAILARTRALLGDQANKIQVIFIATDPPRDTPAALKVFLARFDPTFLGATGSAAELKGVWADYGVDVEDGGETHSSYVYLIDPKGDLRLTYAFPTTPELLSADLRQLLRKN
jgi:protein SCO1